MFNVLLKKSADREYRRLPADIRLRVAKALELLAVDPFSELLDVKKLRTKGNYYRIRIGNYRIVYTVQGKDLVVLIVRIGHRGDVYQHF
jgi:mRNA interferase RelE/StbE